LTTQNGSKISGRSAIPDSEITDFRITGLLEAYGEILGFKDESSIGLCLEYLSREQGIKGHWRCPFGSEKRIRECVHSEQLRALRQKMPRYIAKAAFLFPSKFFLPIRGQ
jgi:hypothetical protein